MTREEAAQTISDLIIAADCEEGLYLWSNQIEALEIAIEVLKQPEQEKDKWNIPSAYPPNSIILEGGKPKKGTWIMNTGLGTICSNCYYKLETTGLLLYCPNCGAYMGGEEK